MPVKERMKAGEGAGGGEGGQTLTTSVLARMLSTWNSLPKGNAKWCSSFGEESANCYLIKIYTYHEARQSHHKTPHRRKENFNSHKSVHTTQQLYSLPKKKKKKKKAETTQMSFSRWLEK